MNASTTNFLCGEAVRRGDEPKKSHLDSITVDERESVALGVMCNVFIVSRDGADAGRFMLSFRFHDK